MTAEALPRASTDKKPSSAQWWRIAQELLKLGGIEAPASRFEASQLIDQLVNAKGEDDDIPF